MGVSFLDPRPCIPSCTVVAQMVTCDSLGAACCRNNGPDFRFGSPRSSGFVGAAGSQDIYIVIIGHSNQRSDVGFAQQIQLKNTVLCTLEIRGIAHLLTGALGSGRSPGGSGGSRCLRDLSVPELLRCFCHCHIGSPVR